MKDESPFDEASTGSAIKADSERRSQPMEGNRKADREVAAMKEALAHARDELSYLRLELDATRGAVKQRDQELDSLRAELAIVQALSERLRASRNIPRVERRSVASHSDPRLKGSAVFSFWRNIRSSTRAAQAESIRNSGLFDAPWYLKQYPEVADARYDPLFHYLAFGAGDGRDPHPLFDSRWYSSTYPDVVRWKLTPLGHFVCIGAARGYDPNPLFHTAWYMARNPDVIAEGANPLRHYIEHSSESGRNPNPLFDSAWYLNEYPDVRASGENPLTHYLHRGIVEFRDPHPLFDTEWYLKTYEHVVATGMDALEHYLTVGAFEGCRPGPGSGDAAARRRRKEQQRDTAPERFHNQAKLNIDSLVRDGMGSRLSPSPTDIMRWQMRLNGSRPAETRFTGTIGVFVHLFYHDLAEEIASSLGVIPFDFKVYISTSDRAKKVYIESVFRRLGIEPVVKILPNRGWDVAPFLLGFAEEMRSHDICLKLHGKRSHHNSDVFGLRWRRYLLSGLLGDRRNVSRIVSSFTANPELGVLMLPHWRGVARRVNAVGPNYRAMQTVLGWANMSISSDQHIEFPSGSMFWFRVRALEPLLDLGLTWSVFQGCRPRSVDATVAHGIERSILFFAASAGFKWAFFHRRWRPRSWNIIRVRRRRLPVADTPDERN